MKKLLLGAVSAAALLTAGSALAAGNSATIDQIGNVGSATVDQTQSSGDAVATVTAEKAEGITPACLAPAGVSPVGVSSPGALQLPMYSGIAAGLPIEAMRDTNTQIEVPIATLGNGKHYALKVADDSMIEAGILDGDTVLIRNGGVAENGQIVAALVDDAEVTLKRLRRRGNSIALEPCNVLHETRVFPAVRVKVQGLMVALLRRYT